MVLSHLLLNCIKIDLKKKAAQQGPGNVAASYSCQDINCELKREELTFFMC